MPRSNWTQRLFLLLVSLSFTVLAQPSAPAPTQQTYSHSAAGLQEQFAAIVNVERSRDERAFRAARLFEDPKRLAEE